jgi:hypothetical protein
VHDVLDAVPLLLSTAFAASSAIALPGFTSKPLPSPPLSAALAVGLRHPVLVAPPPPPAAGARTVMIAVCVPPYVPVMVTDVSADTGEVVIVKSAQPWPAGIVTLAGTCAAAVLLLDSVTLAPPAGALPLRKGVAGMLLPPVVPPASTRSSLRARRRSSDMRARTPHACGNETGLELSGDVAEQLNRFLQ